ncbi:MAG: hypothetical protein K2R93_14520 [Gemmatimonadaceae bacterium]|nr:hypothetical protein [Gemmatimonadaceae bacterium]
MLGTEPKLHPIDRPTKAARTERTVREANALARATSRLAWARAVALAMQSGETPRYQRLHELQAMGVAPAGPIPSPATLARLRSRWEAGAQRLEDYFDHPRTGRPALHRDAEHAAVYRRTVLAARATAPAVAHALMCQAATARGWTSPSATTARRVLADIGHMPLVAARHGSRAAELDAMPTGVVPRGHTHDRWCVDEAMLPIWARFYDPFCRGFRSYRPWIVIVRDHASSVIVGWYVVNPVGPVRPDREPSFGFSSLDVTAALIAAASRDVAPPSCVAFAGAAPLAIRWDNHATHISLEKQWSTQQPGLRTFETERGPVRRPINNGAAERSIGVVKHLLQKSPWHVDAVRPRDAENIEVREGPGRARSLMAAHTTERLARRVLVSPEDLPNHEDVARLVDDEIARYNKSTFRKGRLRRSDVFASRASRSPRPGTELIRLLELQTATVSREGVRCRHDDGVVIVAAENTRERFAAAIPDEITLHLDPAARGAWAVHQRRLIFLRRADQPLTAEERRTFVIEQRIRARRASDEAAAYNALGDEAAGGRGDGFRDDAGDASVDRALVVGSFDQLYAPPAHPDDTDDDDMVRRDQSGRSRALDELLASDEDAL